MFRKLVAVDPVSLLPEAEAALGRYAEKVELFRDYPKDDAEILRRIGDADAVLVSYATPVGRGVIEQCPNIRYIGMCCSLYSEQSANVDIACAREHGIRVLGIRDYGDEGVVEFVVSGLAHLLHGFGGRRWDDAPREMTGLRAGIVGFGTSGSMIGRGLRYFGAQVCYYSRTRKPEAEAEGFNYLPLQELLRESEVVCTCLNKNTVLLHQAEFESLGNRKILINTGLSPAWDSEEFRRWIENDNFFFCDTEAALGASDLLGHPNVSCARQSSGMTKQAYARLSKKVLGNIETFFSEAK